jgi:MoaA/NifB/PqqE/SkfB family radical SAM enzyme
VTILNKGSRKEYALIAITNRCNLSCRHCNIDKNHPLLQTAAERDNILGWIKQIASSYDKTGVSFMGGEPFLCLDDLVEYVKCAKENGLLSSVITNGFWAKSIESAEKTLNKLSGLDLVIVSSDKYHLEFINKETVYNLIDACLKRDIAVHVNVVAADREEGKEISRIYTEKYGDRIFVGIAQMFRRYPPHDFEIEEFNFAKRPYLLRKKCEIMSHPITVDGDVYKCCSGVRLEMNKGPFYLGNLMQEPYEELIKKRDKSVIYRFMHKYGPVGLAKVISMSPLKNEFSEKTFTHQCDMCMWAFENEDFYKYFSPRAHKQLSMPIKG